jgi:hypothetical protein
MQQVGLSGPEAQRAGTQQRQGAIPPPAHAAGRPPGGGQRGGLSLRQVQPAASRFPREAGGNPGEEPHGAF